MVTASIGGDSARSAVVQGWAVGVLIVDDHSAFRSVARTVVALTEGFEVVGEAVSGEEAVELCARLRPGVVLMDIHLPGIDGIEATRRIRRDAPDTVVLLLSTFAPDSLPADAGTCGAARYVHKADFGPTVLTGLLPPARIVVEVACAAADVELVADRLLELGASAVAEHAGAAHTVTLVADLEPTALGALEGVDALASSGTPVTWRTVEVDPAWRSAWREHARAWRAGPFLVRPPWVEAAGEAAPAADEVELVVDPGEAFGSGSHPSTRLCLEAIAGVVREGGRVLDVGCGSGVLAVAALRLGAAAAVGIDIDPAAVVASREVADANGVADRFDVSARPLAEVDGLFDLVLANLLVPVIEELGAALVARVAPGGALVAGGLLSGQRDRAVAALAPLAVQRELSDGEWLALVLRAA